jgi:TetR/AcrR family transcriptional regulator, transcriptional repressor for nem operon
MTTGRMRDDAGTASRILDVAGRLVQTCGFNGFSYADIAAELQISKAALHYHFASKAALGEALIARYASRFMAALASLDTAGGSAPARLDSYVGLYLQVLRNGQMCLCGMLAAEYATLPKAMQKELRHYFEENERWLVQVLEAGRRSGELDFSGAPREVANFLVSSLEGAMMLARSHGDVKRFRVIADRLIADLKT